VSFTSNSAKTLCGSHTRRRSCNPTGHAYNRRIILRRCCGAHRCQVLVGADGLASTRKSSETWILVIIEGNLSTRVLIADDHQIQRLGIRVLLEREGFSVVAEASDGQQALKLAEQFRPEVAILDIIMPILNGLDAAQEIQRVSPKTKIIYLTMHADERYIITGMQRGAKGFVIKTQPAEELIRAIRQAVRGLTYLSPEIDAVVRRYQNNSEIRNEPLSSRERQVLQLIAEGKTTRECACLLEISVKTVETYRKRAPARVMGIRTQLDDLVRF